jgi:secreted trypsin-like serine protease
MEHHMRTKRIALSAGVVAAVAAGTMTAVAAHASDEPVSPMIVDGHAVASAPWAAQLAVGNAGICSGTIIAPHWVLTAKHCVEDDLNPAKTASRLGLL